MGRSLRVAAALAALLWLTADAGPQTLPPNTYPVPLGFCQLSGFSTATLLSSCSGGIPSKAACALIVIETNSVRWRDDGTAPTSSVGMLLATGVYWGYLGKMNALDFIPSTGNATADVTFYQWSCA
jgi:hypothetical protein